MQHDRYQAAPDARGLTRTWEAAGWFGGTTSVPTSRALLGTPHAPALVAAIVANLPSCFDAVVAMLAAAAAPHDGHSDGDGARVRSVQQTLLAVGEAVGGAAEEVRLALQSARTAPTLAIYFTCKLCDEVRCASRPFPSCCSAAASYAARPPAPWCSSAH